MTFKPRLSALLPLLLLGACSASPQLPFKLSDVELPSLSLPALWTTGEAKPASRSAYEDALRAKESCEAGALSDSGLSAILRRHAAAPRTAAGMAQPEERRAILTYQDAGDRCARVLDRFEGGSPEGAFAAALREKDERRGDALKKLGDGRLTWEQYLRQIETEERAAKGTPAPARAVGKPLRLVPLSELRAASSQP